MCDVLVHPTVVRSPDYTERVQRMTGRRMIWSAKGTHAELVPEREDFDSSDYIGTPEWEAPPPNAA